ncbi:hypothetical protein, partial [Streptomyces fildesensis]|uniref:hypothetical protein n=1 Tax=Streptomyces fildesensis TaxID=375757 RepID=UPI001E38253F
MDLLQDLEDVNLVGLQALLHALLLLLFFFFSPAAIPPSFGIDFPAFIFFSATDFSSTTFFSSATFFSAGFFSAFGAMDSVNYFFAASRTALRS